MKYNVGDIVPFEQIQDAVNFVNTIQNNYYLEDYQRDEQGRMMLIVKQFPAPALDKLKQAKLVEVDTWTANKITGGFISNGVRYDSDIEAQTNIQGITLIVNTERFTTDYPHGYPESGYDEGATEKTIHYLTVEEVLMLCSDLSNHINKCRRDGWTMKQEVLEATTKEELDSIILD